MKVYPRLIAYSNVINRVGKAQALEAGKCFCCTQSTYPRVDTEHPHTLLETYHQKHSSNYNNVGCQEKHTIYVGISRHPNKVGPSYYGVGCSAGGGSVSRFQYFVFSLTPVEDPV
jgi:hypothetical protein